jgi:hypothetical protein
MFNDSAHVPAGNAPLGQPTASLAGTTTPFDQGAALKRPENIAKLTDPRSLAIYVRKGASDDERWLSFRIPEGVDQVELLEAGFAIDGNQAVVSVSQTDLDGEGRMGYAYRIFDPKPDWESDDNLPDALQHAEIALMTYLKGRGFSITFK